MARTGLILILILLVIVGALFAFRIIDVQQTRKAELPEVKTQGGQLPTFDVDTPDVDVGTRNETVKVPDISIDRPEDRTENRSDR